MRPELAEHLAPYAASGGLQAKAAATIEAIAQAAIAIGELIGGGALSGDHSRASGVNADGDTQAALDVAANDLVLAALAKCPVASVASEEAEGLVALHAGQPLAVAVDPLDGSSNIDTNLSVGTIFSIRPSDAAHDRALGPFASKGTAQLAAGFVIYGPQTSLALTTGSGVDIFILERSTGKFRLARAGVRIPANRPEYAINASNYRHWDLPVRAYIDDCIAGSEGPRGRNFNMRWIASLVAEVYRILMRGGIFLYPADSRPGYEKGRLRLIYEGQPIGFLVEQAGGWASNGARRILDLTPQALHERTPLILGSIDKVERVEALYREPDLNASQAPLFGRRGLFRT